MQSADMGSAVGTPARTLRFAIVNVFVKDTFLLQEAVQRKVV